MDTLAAESNVSNIDDGNGGSVFNIFDNMCSAIVAWVILSFDSTMRLQEYPKTDSVCSSMSVSTLRRLG